jgi:hypothetical protein
MLEPVRWAGTSEEQEMQMFSRFQVRDEIPPVQCKTRPRPRPDAVLHQAVVRRGLVGRTLEDGRHQSNNQNATELGACHDERA